MTEKTKPVWVSARTRRELLERAGELQAKTGKKVSLGKLIEVALRLLDTDAAARLIRSGDIERCGGGNSGGKSEAADPTEAIPESEARAAVAYN